MENRAMTAEKEVLLSVENLKKYFPIKKGIFKKTIGHMRAVDGIDLNVKAGEVLALLRKLDIEETHEFLHRGKSSHPLTAASTRNGSSA